MTSGDGILIIDPDETIRDLLGEFFGAQGNRVYAAENTAEALQIIDTCPIPVALIDIGLGNSCPPEQIDRLRQANPDLKFILLSGSPTVESVIDALRMKVFDFVVKPFYLKDLRSIVSRAMAESRRRPPAGVMQRRIDRLEEILHRHGLTPPNDDSSESVAQERKDKPTGITQNASVIERHQERGSEKSTDIGCQ